MLLFYPFTVWSLKCYIFYPKIANNMGPPEKSKIQFNILMVVLHPSLYILKVKVWNLTNMAKTWLIFMILAVADIYQPVRGGYLWTCPYVIIFIRISKIWVRLTDFSLMCHSNCTVPIPPHRATLKGVWCPRAGQGEKSDDARAGQAFE